MCESGSASSTQVEQERTRLLTNKILRTSLRQTSCEHSGEQLQSNRSICSAPPHHVECANTHAVCVCVHLSALELDWLCVEFSSACCCRTLHPQHVTSDPLCKSER